MNVRITKKTSDDTSAVAELEEVVEAVEQLGSTGVHARSARVAYYSIAVALVIMLLMGWLSTYYVIATQTAQSQATADVLQQMNARLVSLEAVVRPRPQPPQQVSFTSPADAPRLGDVSAPVEIVEFSDFQCPYCAKFQQEVYPRIKAEYIDTGKASFVYQDFAFLGEESTRASLAAKCAKAQGKFWEYHDYLFTQQSGENAGALSDAKLRSFAGKVGLQQGAFNTCLQQGTLTTAVEAETAAGRAIGVTGTPTVLVNGKMYVGALPYEQFKAAIEQALAEKQK